MFQSVLRRLRARQTAELEGAEAAEAGFTLIELMVVLLIIAILLAIAIPTFLGVTSSANDRAAQSNLTNGLTEATAQYQSSGQTFSGVQALLSASAPEYTWNSSGANCTTSTANCISVNAVDVATSGDAQGLVISAMSKTGTCWWVVQLQATPVAIASTGFELSATQTVVGSETGATSAGTFYAKQAPGSANYAVANCDAAYPETVKAFKWGASFSAAGAN